MLLTHRFDRTTRDDVVGPTRRLAVAGAGAVLMGALIASGGLPADEISPAGDAAAPALLASPTAFSAGFSTAIPAASPAAVGLPGDWRQIARLTSFEAAALGGFADLRVGVPERRPSEASAPAAETRAAPTDDAFVVVIDPGHGGTDPGSVAPNGLLEKELTADIALRVRRFLSEVDGVEVVLTREGDTGLSRQGRVNRIRRASADLVVSLHFNHLPQPHVTLVESFYAAVENIEESRALRRAAAGNEFVQVTAPDLSFTEGSERLAGLMQRRVFGEVVHGNPAATDAGVKRDTLFVLTRSMVPGALIELTCLSNPGEAERLEGEAYRNRLAAALADAVRDYRGSLETRPLGALDT